MITINAEKKAALDACNASPPRDVTAELDALTAALVKKQIVSNADIEAAATEQDARVDNMQKQLAPDQVAAIKAPPA